jgi:hypothetical protein
MYVELFWYIEVCCIQREVKLVLFYTQTEYKVTGIYCQVKVDVSFDECHRCTTGNRGTGRIQVTDGITRYVW